MAEFIYTMHNVRKAVGDNVILDDVTLSFYPGAKIGVVGPNGAGKSTMLKLMAGLDKPNNGDANQAKGGSDASRWRPVRAAQCGYAVRYVAVKAAYGLPTDAAEKRALADMLTTCG